MINLKRELKNIGIKPIEQLSVQEKTNIAEQVATKLSSLNVMEMSHNSVLEKIFDAKMYTAQMSTNLGHVSYFIKNKTIYFDKNLDLSKINENILHECIHYLQDKSERKQKNGKRIGLCTFEEYKVRGMALNEVGIRYISNKLLKHNDKNKTFILLKQMLLITGEEVFFDSILNNNDNFQRKFMEQTNSESLYYKIENTFDSMFDLEQIIKRLNIDGKTSKTPERYLSKINMHKHTINTKFSEAQWEMYNKYFSRKIELIDKIEEIKDYKNEIFNFNQWLEMSEDEPKYTNFAEDKFDELNKIELQILRLNANNSMILVDNTPIHRIVKFIKKIIFRQKEYGINKQ